MATIADIPVRNGEDGSAQLAFLRSYLKDRDGSEYRYTDDYLITLLVKKGKVSVWQGITGYSGKTPWSYMLDDASNHIARIRTLTGDTDESALEYTDYDLEVFLETIPLRYVVKLILAEKANVSTFPSDPFNPIHIFRKYRGDTDLLNALYTDSQIVELLFSSRVNPYELVADMATQESASGIVEKVSTSDSNLASIDGISFSEEGKLLGDLSANVNYVKSLVLSSPYWKEPVYNFWKEGVPFVEGDWEVKWYGL